MSLSPQNIYLRFGLGIDTKVDPKQQLLTTLRRAVNVTYETISSLKKRNGYDRIPLYTVTGEQITGAQKLTNFKKELDVFANNQLYSLSEVTQELAPKGPVYPVYVESSPVINASTSATTSDVALIDGLEIHSWSTSDGNIRYSIKDNQNNSFLASNNLVGTGSVTKIATVNGYAYIFYADGANIYYRRVAVTAPETLEAAQVLANNLDTSNKVFDVQESGGKIFLAYTSSVAGARLRVIAINGDGSLGSGLGIPGTPVCKAITLHIDSLQRVDVLFASAADVKFLQLNYILSGILVAETTIDATADCKNIGVLEDNSGNLDVWYEIGAISATNNYIKKIQLDDVGAITVAAMVFIRSLGLHSRPYYINDLPYIVAVFGSSVQSTAFILDQDAKVVAKFAAGVSSGLSTVGSLPHVALVDSDTALISSRYATKVEAENGTIFSVLGVASAEVSHLASNPLQVAELGDNLHVAGGIIRAYDGDEMVEHGFHVFPESITAGSTASVGGFMSNGNYGYVAIYRWTDNYGQEHKSSYSANLDVVLSGGTATQIQNIVVPTLRITDKTEVVIELYRTENNGSIYYLTATGSNDTTVDTVTILDTTSDASLIEELPLYTTGDVLDNGPAPSATVIGVHTSSNRLFTVSEDGNTLIYSKIRNQGQPVEWNEALVKPIDPIGGRVTVLVSMDEKLIIFKEDAILFISGSGPNNLGQQDNFTEPERVAIDVGCTEPESVVLIPDGLMFKSRKGIYILGRAMSLDYIGSQVEEFNNLQITSAKLIRRNNQVRFTTLTGECLVYNYFLKLWSTFDNHAALSAATVGDDYYYVRSSSELFKENLTSFSDNGSPISILVETAWMSFAQLQGFQRIYRMLVIGDYKSEHNLRVRAAYNFNTAWTHEKVLNPVPDIVSGVAYGDASPYGSESPYGGDGSPYQARFDFEKQKCQSIKLQFQDLQTTPGEGLSLSAILLETGLKKGLFKPGQSKIKGVS